MRTTLALLVRLHLRRLWTQRLRTVLAIGAVAAGTSLAVGVAIVLTSTTASLDAFGRSVGGPAPLRVVGATVEDGIPASVAASAVTGPMQAAGAATDPVSTRKLATADGDAKVTTSARRAAASAASGMVRGSGHAIR